MLFVCRYPQSLRDWPLSTGRGGGGYKTGGGGGHVKFYPYEKEGADKVLAMPKGRGTKSFGVVFTR